MSTQDLSEALSAAREELEKLEHTPVVVDASFHGEIDVDPGHTAEGRDQRIELLRQYIDGLEMAQAAHIAMKRIHASSDRSPEPDRHYRPSEPLEAA